jgi:hypothetical protein
VLAFLHTEVDPARQQQGAVQARVRRGQPGESSGGTSGSRTPKSLASARDETTSRSRRREGILRRGITLASVNLIRL